MQKQIDKLTSKLQIQNIYNTNTNSNNIINYNIKLLNYNLGGDGSPPVLFGDVILTGDWPQIKAQTE